KPGKLTDEEFELVRAHARAGAELLSGSRSPVIRMAESIALSHHERWDGRGYPDGIAGEDIPLESRIVPAADPYDAITRDRAHTPAMTMALAIEEIESNSGRQFDPTVVRAFLLAIEAGEIVAPLTVKVAAE